jgi:hypothetical protein
MRQMAHFFLGEPEGELPKSKLSGRRAAAA